MGRPPTLDQRDGWLTTNEARKVLGISRRELFSILTRERLVYRQIHSSGVLLFEPSSIQRVLEKWAGSAQARADSFKVILDRGASSGR